MFESKNCVFLIPQTFLLLGSDDAEKLLINLHILRYISHQVKDTHLKIYHIPESLQIRTRGFLFTGLKLTVVHETRKLLKTLRHEQLRLTDGGSDLTRH